MKRFVAKLALFALPLLAGAVCLYGAPYAKRVAYGALNRHCADRGRWIHDRIFLDPRPIDVMFVGTSKIMFSVDDGRIEKAVRDERGEPIHVANLAFCEQGRNLQYAVIKDVLRTRRVRHIVLGAFAREPRRSHPVFAYVAEAEDILVRPRWGNEHWARDLFAGLAARLEPLRRSLLFPAAEDAPQVARPHGYLPISETAPPGELEREKRQRERRAERREGWDRRPELSLPYPRHYLDAIGRMSRERGARLHFLFMPVYGEPWGEMEALEIYRRHGEVLLPPRSIFETPAHWGDPTHLNETGARLLTEWLVQRIVGWE